MNPPLLSIALAATLLPSPAQAFVLTFITIDRTSTAPGDSMVIQIASGDRGEIDLGNFGVTPATAPAESTLAATMRTESGTTTPIDFVDNYWSQYRTQQTAKEKFSRRVESRNIDTQMRIRSETAYLVEHLAAQERGAALVQEWADRVNRGEWGDWPGNDAYNRIILGKVYCATGRADEAEAQFDVALNYSFLKQEARADAARRRLIESWTGNAAPSPPAP